MGDGFDEILIGWYDIVLSARMGQSRVWVRNTFWGDLFWLVNGLGRGGVERQIHTTSLTQSSTSE